MLPSFGAILYINFLSLIAVNTMPSTSVKISHDKPGKKGLVEVLQDNEVPESFPPSSLPNNHNEFENGNPSSFEDEPHMLANNVQSLKLEKHSPKSRNVKAKSNAEYKPEEWMFPDKEGTLSQLNLAIVSPHLVKLNMISLLYIFIGYFSCFIS